MRFHFPVLKHMYSEFCRLARLYANAGVGLINARACSSGINFGVVDHFLGEVQKLLPRNTADIRLDFWIEKRRISKEYLLSPML